MNTRQSARVDAFKRSKQFGKDNAGDFNPKPPKTEATVWQNLQAELATLIEAAEGKHAVQQGGAVGAATTDKAVLRDALMGDLRLINGSVGYLSEEKHDPAMMDRFRMPNGHNDAELVAKARAFLTAIEELGIEEELLGLAHDENFTDTLDARIEEFTGADDSQSGAEQQRVGATRSLPTVISRGLTVLKGLNAIANNKYQGDAAKFGAWKTASHIERTGQKPKAKPAPAPTPTLTTANAIHATTNNGNGSANANQAASNGSTGISNGSQQAGNGNQAHALTDAR